MSKRKFLLTLAVITLMIAGTNHVTAQAPAGPSPGSFKGDATENALSMGPSARPFDATETAFIDTDYYSYDAQLWAPWDVTSVDGSIPFQSGFYAELGYAYYSLTRPKAIPGQDPRNFNTGTDYHWATQLEIGWYSTKDRGWGGRWTDLEGIAYVTGENILIMNPMLLRTKIDDVQLNRQFRQRLSNGGWIEPYAGLRYYTLTDRSTEDNTLAASSRFQQQITNSAFGGQIGSKYFRQYNRFRVGGEAAVGILYNNQLYYSNTIVTGANLFEYTNASASALPMLDLGVQLSFALTRDITLRGGIDLQYIWQGVARADIRTAQLNPHSGFAGVPIPDRVNSEDVVMAGFSFGLDWKR